MESEASLASAAAVVPAVRLSETSLKEEEDAVRCMVAVLYSPHSRAAAATATQQQWLPTSAEANVFLTDFQQRPAAWPVCISILNRFTVQQQQLEQQGQQQELGEDECSLLYFAAQTLATVARAGFPQQLQLLLGMSNIIGMESADSAAGESSSEQQQREQEKRQAVAAVYKELQHGLLQLLYGCRKAPRPVVRQLACALANALLCGAACRGSSFLDGEATAAAAAGYCSNGAAGQAASSSGDSSTQTCPTAAGNTGQIREDMETREQEKDIWRELSTDLDEVLLALGRNVGAAGAAPLLEVLTVLPQEAASPRVAVQDGQRLRVLLAMLRRYTVDALVIIAVVYHSAETADKQELQHAAAGRKLEEAWSLRKTAVCAMRAWISAHLQLFLSLPALAAFSAGLETAATSCCRGLFVALQRHHHQQQTLPELTAAAPLHSHGGTAAAAAITEPVFLPSSATGATLSAPAAAAEGRSPSPLAVLLQCLSRAAAFTGDTASSFPDASLQQQQQQQQQQQRKQELLLRAELETLQEASEAVAALSALAVAVISPQQQQQLAESSGSAGTHEQVQTAEAQQLQQSLPSIHFVMQRIVSCYAHACARFETLQSQQQQQGAVWFAAEHLRAFSQGLLELAKEVLPGFLHSAAWPVEAPEAKYGEAAAAADRENNGSTAARGGVELHSSRSLGGMHDAAEVKEICAFVCSVLMRHRCLDVKEIAVDFHYNLLFHFVSLASEQQEMVQHLEALQYEQQQQQVQGTPFAASPEEDLETGRCAGGAQREEQTAAEGEEAPVQYRGGSVEEDTTGGRSGSRAAALAAEVASARASYACLRKDVEEKRRRLQPLFTHFLNVLVAEIGPPAAAAVVREEQAAAAPLQETAAAPAAHTPQQQEPFDFERWAQLRDESAINIVEATIVTGHQMLLQQAADTLSAALGFAVPPPTMLGDGSERGESEALWRRLETSLFVMTTLSSRCKGEETACLPRTLELLPQLLLPFVEAKREGAAAAAKEEVVCLFLYTAAARFVLWTAGYAPHDKHLFATLFELLGKHGMQFLIAAAQRHREASLDTEDAAVCQLRAAAEDVVVEALKALVAAAAPTLLATEDADAEDVTVILQCLVSLVLIDGLSLESRSGLILAAGAALAPLPAARMRMLHSQMLQSLGANVCDALSHQQPRGRSSAATAARHAVTLFFSGLQCVRPVHVPLPPPASPAACCEPLPPDSPFRHPVLDVLEEHWHVVEAVMHAPLKHEYLYEQSCYSIFSIISAARTHLSRYTIFFRFVECLATSFEAYPTAYHLGVLRSLAGLCGDGTEQPLLTAVAVCLKRCTLATLQRIQEEGDSYVYRQPDLVGMMVDCVNMALLHVHLVVLCMEQNSDSSSSSSNWFELLTLAILQLAPTCHHPKVLHTFIIFFSRLAAWTSPPTQLYARHSGENIPWLEQTCSTFEEAMISLMLRPYPPAAAAGVDADEARKGSSSCSSSSCSTYLDATIHAIIKALTSVHTAVQSWIGNAAQALLVLLHHSAVAQQALAALEAAVRELHPHVLDAHQRKTFLRRCRTETNIRNFCLLLQQTANDTKAQFQRSKFAMDKFAVGSPPSPLATVPAAATTPAAAPLAAATGIGAVSVPSSDSAGGACCVEEAMP